MTAAIVLDVRGIDEVRAALVAYGHAAQRAATRAINKTLAAAQRRGLRQFAAKNDIPLRAITRSKRSRLYRAQSNRPSALAWLGTRPVKAGYLGTPRQLKAGAKVRRRLFEGAFVATLKSGHVGIFRRKAASSLPIVEQTVDLEAGSNEYTGVVDNYIALHFKRVFAQELNFEVNVRGRA